MSADFVLKYINDFKIHHELHRQVGPHFPWLSSPFGLISGTQFPELAGIQCHRDIRRRDQSLPSIYRDLRKWFLSVGPGPGGRAGVQGRTYTEKGMIIVCIRSTNRQIKFVNIFYSFYLGQRNAKDKRVTIKRVAAPLQTSRLNGLEASTHTSAKI